MRPEPDPSEEHVALSLEAFRTLLASERTFLSYVRTAIAMLVGGGAVLQFFTDRYIRLIGWGLLPGSVLLALWGWRRYAHVRRALNHGHAPRF